MLALALGIGANTAIYSIFYATLIADFPNPHSEQLVVVWSKINGDRNVVSASSRWRSFRSREPPAFLLLEQILKRLASIHGSCLGRGGSLFLHPHADGKEGAVVAGVLARNPLLHRLAALEPGGRFEVATLFAGVQFESALRAFSQRLAQRGQQGPALGATRYCGGRWHIQGPRTEGIVAAGRFALGFLGFPAFFVAVLVSTLAVFPV
jgi:hypothetical protein